MNEISLDIDVPVAKALAFELFVNKLSHWWPKAYTWSKELLVKIKIDAAQDGLCTELGPYGFRCDWGRVAELVVPDRIWLKWQISSARVPVPDPGEASDVVIRFEQAGPETRVVLQHLNFKNHGEGWQQYQQQKDKELNRLNKPHMLFK
jgi:hypothetical protein